MMIEPGWKVYQGMIIGEHTRENDLEINVLKGKQLTNIRAAGKDEAVRLTPPIRMTLEKALAYIEDDELVEVTPKSIRLRKTYLDPNERKRAVRAKEIRLTAPRQMIDSAGLVPYRGYLLPEAFIPELPGYYRGKVRENYDLANGERILIATDRISAFDQNLAVIPFKGQVLTRHRALLVRGDRATFAPITCAPIPTRT